VPASSACVSLPPAIPSSVESRSSISGKVVEKLTKEFASQQRAWERRGLALDFLRVNGTGDLFAELVPVLNGFARLNPDVRLWIVTRRLDLAAGIRPLPNVYLQLSLDATTPPAHVEVAHQLIATHPRSYLSFLRTTATDDTGGAAVIFNEKGNVGLPYEAGRACPVDAGRRSLGNVRGVGGTACSRCGRCFTDRTLAQQRDLLGLSRRGQPSANGGGGASAMTPRSPAAGESDEAERLEVAATSMLKHAAHLQAGHPDCAGRHLRLVPAVDGRGDLQVISDTSRCGRRSSSTPHRRARGHRARTPGP